MADLNVRKRGDKWEYRFEGAKIEGKRKQISKGGFRTKKEAQEAGIKSMNEYNNTGKLFIPSELSLSDLLDDWMENYCKVELKKTTISGYEKNIRLHIKPSLGKYYAKSILTGDIQRFLNEKFNEGYSRNRMIAFKGILNKSLTYAKRMGYIDANPALEAEIPSIRAKSAIPTRKKQRDYIQPDIFDAIIDRFPEGHSCYLPLMLGYRAGLRIGECFALTWDDVDFDNSSISINQQIQWQNHKWVFDTPKYDSFRTIVLDDDTMKLLRKTKTQQRKALLYYGEYYTHLYVNQNKELNTVKDGNPADMVMRRENGTYIQERVMQHCSSVIHHKMGISNFDYHSLRHTHASMLIESGADPKDVQKRLGHKRIETTLNVYTHATPIMENKTKLIINDIYKL